MTLRRHVWIPVLLMPLLAFQNCSPSGNFFGADSFEFSSISTAAQGDFSSEIPQLKECGTSLAPGESCYVAVQFTPKTAGNHSGSLQIISDDKVIGTVTLTGQGE